MCSPWPVAWARRTAAWASRRLKRSVRWTGERSEGFLSDIQGRDHVTRARLATDAKGVFTGLQVTTHANMGAYLSNFAPFVATGAGVAMLAGLYKTPAIHVTVLGVSTNTVPVDAYRGAGRPEAIYVIERLVDALGGAALDVVDPEPLPPDHALLSAPNTIFTPHIGARSPGGQARMEKVVEDVIRVLKGEPPLFPASVPGTRRRA